MKRSGRPLSVLAVVFLTGLFSLSTVERARGSERAEEIHKAFKGAFEDEFGVLDGKVAYEKTQIFGTVIGVDLKLKEGKLEDGWTAKVVSALATLGVKARDEDVEVRAEEQSVAGHNFVSLQVTSSRGTEEQDSLAAILMIGP